MNLDEDQQRVVELNLGLFSVMAGAGSGKSTVLLHRVARLRDEHPNDKILCVTFTSEAAKNLRNKIRTINPRVDQSCFSTLHSLALKFAHAHPDAYPFKLSDNPLGDESVSARCVFDSIGDSINFRAFTTWVSLQKRNRISPDYAVLHAEKTGVKLDYAIGYKRYQSLLRKQGVLDFDDLIFYMVEILESRPDIRSLWQYDWVMQDEAQDACELDWRMLQLLTQKNKNLLCVGDVGQCQPPGTLITVLDKLPTLGRNYSCCTFKQVPIEHLKDGDDVVSWTKNPGQRTYPTAKRKIKVASRHYKGDLINICANGFTTKTTPNHKLWVRWNKKVFEDKPYFVYLMYKEGLGFRVGTSHIRRTGTIGANQITLRGKQERADKMWILEFVDSKGESQVREEIISLKYRIPESVFRPYNGCVKTDEQIKRVFKSVEDNLGGFNCLEDYGLLFEHPLVQWPLNGKPKFHGYFLTVAANVVSGFMDIPLPGINKSSCISSVIREDYEGEVFSLDVEKDHTYVADGLVVGNSLFGFRGGISKHFLEMDKMFPGTETHYLGNNYRSLSSIVDFGKQAYPYPEIATHFKSTRQELGIVSITPYSTDQREAEETIEKIQKISQIEKLESCAVLARTNLALRLFEEEMLEKGVQYHILGDSGFWESPEVKNVLFWIRCATQLTDNAILGALRTPFYPTKYLKKKVMVEKIQERIGKGETAWQALGYIPELSGFRNFIGGLFKYQYQPTGEAVKGIIKDLKALEHYSGEENINPDRNPIQNLKELASAASRHGDLQTFLDFLRRLSYSRNNRKGVCLSTIHSAKGREWPHVFFVSCNEGIVPHSKSDNLEEEHCCFFVGVSRAMDSLDVSYYNQPSRFLGPWIKEQDVSLS